jgi:hypothetical protein
MTDSDADQKPSFDHLARLREQLEQIREQAWIEESGDGPYTVIPHFKAAERLIEDGALDLVPAERHGMAVKLVLSFFDTLSYGEDDADEPVAQAQAGLLLALGRKVDASAVGEVVALICHEYDASSNPAFVAVAVSTLAGLCRARPDDVDVVDIAAFSASARLRWLEQEYDARSSLSAHFGQKAAAAFLKENPHVVIAALDGLDAALSPAAAPTGALERLGFLEERARVAKEADADAYSFLPVLREARDIVADGSFAAVAQDRQAEAVEWIHAVFVTDPSLESAHDNRLAAHYARADLLLQLGRAGNVPAAARVAEYLTSGAAMAALDPSLSSYSAAGFIDALAQLCDARREDLGFRFSRIEAFSGMMRNLHKPAPGEAEHILAPALHRLDAVLAPGRDTRQTEVGARKPRGLI